MFLNRAFSNKSRVLILRTLSNNDRGLTNSQVAELTGLSEMAVSRNVRDLSKEGLIETRRVGNALVSDINEANHVGFLLKYLFKWEEESTEGLKEIVRDRLKNELDDVVSMVVFGSRARGDERLDSDMDVMVITEKGHPEATASMMVEGILVSVFQIPKEAFLSRARSKDPLALNVIFEGDVIYGKKEFKEILEKSGV
jgi:predicted nucleotidyltransferase